MFFVFSWFTGFKVLSDLIEAFIVRLNQGLRFTMTSRSKRIKASMKSKRNPGFCRASLCHFMARKHLGQPQVGLGTVPSLLKSLTSSRPSLLFHHVNLTVIHALNVDILRDQTAQVGNGAFLHGLARH